jgi:hypothetical protein
MYIGSGQNEQQRKLTLLWVYTCCRFCRYDIRPQQQGVTSSPIRVIVRMRSCNNLAVT